MARKRVNEVEKQAPRGRAKPRKGNVDDRDDHPRFRQCRCRKAKPGTINGTKDWQVVDVCGQRYLVKVDPVYDARKLEGACTFTDNQIEVLEQALDRMHDTLLHEIIHAANDASGLKWALMNAFPNLSLKERRAIDEMICRFLAPALLGTLRGAGWLKLPEWPPRRLPKTKRHRSAK